MDLIRNFICLLRLHVIRRVWCVQIPEDIIDLHPSSYLWVTGRECGGFSNKMDRESLHHLLIFMIHNIDHFSVKTHQHLENTIQIVDAL